MSERERDRVGEKDVNIERGRDRDREEIKIGDISPKMIFFFGILEVIMFL